MYTLETLITLVLLALIIGLIAGAIIAQRIAPSKQSQREMEKHFEKLQQQQKNYQQEVAKHFSQTGQLLDQLTTSYREVHNHLASGAQLLANHEAGESIGILPEGEPNNPKPTDEHNLMPPLDYAPKSTPYEQGMLSEKFGLDEVKSEETEQAELTRTATGNQH